MAVVGLAHAEVRAHILQVVEELATEYETDGVELDFALPGGAPRILREEDVEATTPILTDYVEQLAERVRGQRSGVVGARVLPTEEMNLAQGLDVRTWLERGLVDFLVPIRYGYMILERRYANRLAGRGGAHGRRSGLWHLAALRS